MSYYYVGADAVGRTKLENMREEAQRAVLLAGGVFTLAWYKKDGSSGIKKFANHDELMDAYGLASDDQVTYNYVAAFSQDPVQGQGTFPGPFAEFGEAIKTAVVRSNADPVVQPPAKKSAAGMLGWIIAGVAATLGAMGLAKSKRGRTHV